jgi:3-hydroxyisobutyrate dehydrogenase-like beta-hydroxyacid dehydrogenase
LAVAAAQQLGFKTPLGKLTADTFARALAHGLAGEDDASLIKLVRHDN